MYQKPSFKNWRNLRDYPKTPQPKNTQSDNLKNTNPFQISPQQ
jgi:hypothetical protein